MPSVHGESRCSRLRAIVIRDARGGAALSVREVVGKPIVYAGIGEEIENLEQFHPDRMAGRILGMGDVLTLVEKAQDAVDENGHVNNVAYVRWMQDAAVAHSDAAGCTRETQAAGATWVARSHYVEYLRPAFAGDRLAVLTWVVNWRRVRSLRKFRFRRESDGVVLAVGQTDWVFVDATTGRPRTIARPVREAFVLVPEGEEPAE